MLDSYVSHKIRGTLRDAVANCDLAHPAVYISGGVDSTILLSLINELTSGSDIYTYTFGIKGDENNELIYAKRVADYYKTKHTEVVISPKEYFNAFTQILETFDKPRWNLWPYFLARAAEGDGRRTGFLAEGLDEHFSGYWYKPNLSYQQAWADHFAYIMPTHKQVHQIFDLQVSAPFAKIDVRIKSAEAYEQLDYKNLILTLWCKDQIDSTNAPGELAPLDFDKFKPFFPAHGTTF